MRPQKCTVLFWSVSTTDIGDHVSVRIISRKCNFLLPIDHLTMSKTDGRKSFNLVKSHELICHFIRGYLAPLLPYSIFYKNNDSKAQFLQ